MIEEIRQAQRIFHKAALSAAEQIQKAEKLGEKSEDGSYHLGLAAYELRLYSIAEEYFRLSNSLNEKSEKVARLAMTAWRSNNLVEAEEWALRSIKLEPNGKITTTLSQVDICFTSIFAAILLDRGKIEESISASTSSLNTNPDDIVARYSRASAYILKNCHKEAIDDLEHALATPLCRERGDELPDTIGLKRTLDLAKKLKDADLLVTPTITHGYFQARWPD